MNSLKQLCEELVEMLPGDQAMELLDILTTAKHNGYENQEVDSFPQDFYEMYDKAITNKY